MADPLPESAPLVTVRLWAAARAAAGQSLVELEVPGPVSVTWLREELVRRHPDDGRLDRVLQVCSVLVGDRPVGTADPATVQVEPGATVEFLPPFAGG
jgi:molybdopterin converting factor small subunit